MCCLSTLADAADELYGFVLGLIGRGLEIVDSEDVVCCAFGTGAAAVHIVALDAAAADVEMDDEPFGSG